MGVPGNADLLLLRSAAAAGGYQVERSLRFNSADSAYLSRTPASAGNRKTWTWAGWVKRSAFGTAQVLFSATDGTTPFTIYLDTDDTLFIGDPAFAWKITAQKFRDSGAWGHLVVAVDTTQASNANRAKIYWNNTQVSLAGDRDLYSNTDLSINGAFAHNIGRSASSSSQYFSGCLADVIFVDGQALTPSSFTEVDATTGQLIPKAYTGSFGTNGFWLKFSDNSAATATTLGKDYSGNSNNWTPNNLSVTAGAGNDSLVDTPTSYGTDTGAGGEVRGNYCTWNPLKKASVDTLSNGNLDATLAGSANATHIYGTMGVSSGKWYWEVTANSVSSVYPGPGVCTDLNRKVDLTTTSSSDYIYMANGQKRGSSATTYGASFSANDVIGVALDMDAGTITFYKNGVSQGQAFSGITGTAVPVVLGGLSVTISTNFGQRPFAYTAPSGFKALCDTNLPAPVVAQPSTVMDVKLYTGNGSTQTISGLGFSPDLVWIKGRSGPAANTLVDAARGVNSQLMSNLTVAEETVTDAVTALTSSGFSLGANTSGVYPHVNVNAYTYVAWTWDAGSSTVTNTQGSITSSVRANASAGFSIVTYTGTGANATVGHGLNVAPSLVIVKRRDSTSNWLVWNSVIAASNAANVLFLDTTDAALANSTNFNSTSPTSTVFTVGTNAATNASGGTHVAYCFAPVAGYSSFGSYTGNGSTDGPFVYTGFRSRWIIIKSSSNLEDWRIYDTARDTYNLSAAKLYPNLSAAENGASGESASTNTLDVLSNGFKLRTSNSATNASSYSYIYAAFAENPFQFARAR